MTANARITLTSQDLERLLQFSVDLAKKAGAVILEGSYAIRGELGSATSSTIDSKKNAVDLVTEWDVKVEELVKREIEATYPAFGFIGEESYSKGVRPELTDDPTFCVDPIDGTTNFIHGFPFACISIGVIYLKKPVIGVIYNPFLDQLYSALKGYGAFLNSTKRLPLSPPAPLPSLSSALAGIVIAQEAGGFVSGGSHVGHDGQVSPDVLQGRKYIVVRAIADTPEESGIDAQKRIVREFYETKFPAEAARGHANQKLLEARIPCFRSVPRYKWSTSAGDVTGPTRMLEDLLFHSDGFAVVDSLFRRQRGIKGAPAAPSAFAQSTWTSTSDPDFLQNPHLLFDEINDTMSLTRALFNEFRPLFRMFDDAAFRPISLSPRHHHRHQDVTHPFETFFESPLRSGFGRAAAVDLTEEANQYVIEAELPGVKKENLEVTVGDNGRSITIEGKTFARSAPVETGANDAASTSAPNANEGSSNNDVEINGAVFAVTKRSDDAAVTADQNEWVTRSSFSRTIWLPRAVDASKISGKLEDGVLRLTIPKVEEPAHLWDTTHLTTMDDLQHLVFEGSPVACLALGDQLLLNNGHRTTKSPRRHSRRNTVQITPRLELDTADASPASRAALLYIIGIVWATRSILSATVHHPVDPSSSTGSVIPKFIKAVVGPITSSPFASPRSRLPNAGDHHTTADPSSNNRQSDNDLISPTATLLHDLIQHLTQVLQQSTFSTRHEFFPPSSIPNNISSPLHKSTLLDAFASLGWTDQSPLSIPTISHRLSLDVSSSMMTARADTAPMLKGPTRHDRALATLLSDLSRASSSSTHRSGHSSPSSVDAAEEDSAYSSYPTSPITRTSRDVSPDTDNRFNDRNEYLNDSPPTTPSHTSSSDDLSKTFVPKSPVHRNLLQERLALRLDIHLPSTSKAKASPGFPRSETRDSTYSTTNLSITSSPLSTTSTHSTASSILAQQSKSGSTTSLFAEARSTMGAFTPVSAKTAAGSLRRFGLEKKGWSLPRIRTRAALPQNWDSPADDTAPDAVTSPENSASPSTSAQPVSQPTRSPSSVSVPSICLTHSSFLPESVLKANAVPTATVSISERVPPPTPKRSSPPRQATIPKSASKSSRSPPSRSPPTRHNSTPVAPRKPQAVTRNQRSISLNTGAFPPLDPTLAALEKSCRLRSQVTCAACGKTGWDFPKNKYGQALCSRECRIVLKAKECGVAPSSLGASKAAPKARAAS
ncbi:hypothetical protein FRB99_008537 [Tulasnella sp. 403]|nr:hypothetical protein FRB99_008537 [Tulasnella sp. 403]